MKQTDYLKRIKDLKKQIDDFYTELVAINDSLGDISKENNSIFNLTENLFKANKLFTTLVENFKENEVENIPN